VPVYQYACTECGEQLEVRQSFTDDALTVCPNCSGRLRKVLSAVGVVFKGSGFYRTDSRSDDKSASTANAKANSSSNGGSESSSTTKESSGKEAPAASKEKAGSSSSGSNSGSSAATVA
jgi:putative FmdB family regulatory protein